MSCSPMRVPSESIRYCNDYITNDFFWIVRVVGVSEPHPELGVIFQDSSKDIILSLLKPIARPIGKDQLVGVSIRLYLVKIDGPPS